MKRSPLKPGKALKRRTPLKAKKGFKVTGEYSSFKKKQYKTDVASPQARYLLSKTELPLEDKGILKSGSKRKSKSNNVLNSMTGHGRSKDDQYFHSIIVSNGCMACLIEGRDPTHPLQVHHPYGRNKGREGDFSEKFAICLCCEHHDTRSYKGYYSGEIFVPVRDDCPSVHSAKKQFYMNYGSEALLVHETYEILDIKPCWLTNEEWSTFLSISKRDKRDKWASEIVKPSEMKNRRSIALKNSVDSEVIFLA